MGQHEPPDPNAQSLNAGTVNIQNANPLGSSASGTTVSSGAQLQIQGAITASGATLTKDGTGSIANSVSILSGATLSPVRLLGCPVIAKLQTLPFFPLP